MSIPIYGFEVLLYANCVIIFACNTIFNLFHPLLLVKISFDNTNGFYCQFIKAVIEWQSLIK